MRDPKYILVALANARTGEWSRQWARRVPVATHAQHIVCGLCGVLIATERFSERASFAHTDTTIFEHGRRHLPAIKYMIDNDLYVLRQQAIDELFSHSWNALVKDDILPKIGVVQVCNVMVGPKWVTDVMNGWIKLDLRLQVIRRASCDEDFRDALSAAVDLPDPDGLGTFIASQFWEELQREIAEDTDE